MSLDKDLKVLVCVGSGGVGKTTMASGIAAAAAKAGRKVLVMTVDPSRRLATTLGLDQGASGIVPIKGWDNLSATLIQPREIFDQFVRQCSTGPEMANRLLENPLYIQLSTTLAGSQEFTSLNLLYDAYQSGDYDLIVLDTPPTQHAVDFFEAPQKIHDVFQSSVTKWFIKRRSRNPIKSLFDSGTMRVIKLFENLTGAEFMSQVHDFFVDVQPLQEEIRKRTIACQRLLASGTTGFALVTSFDEAKLNEAKSFRDHIVQNGYNLSSMIINRAYPEWMESENLQFSSYEWKQRYEEYVGYYQHRMKKYDEFALNLNQIKILKVAEMSSDLSTLADVERAMEKVLQ